MSRGRETDERYSRPEVAHVCRNDNGYNAQGANQQGCFAGAIYTPASFQELRRQPAAQDASYRRRVIDHDQRQRHAARGQPVFARQEFWQPEKEEPPDGVRQKLSYDESPCLPERQETQPGNFHDRLVRITLNVAKLAGRKPRMLLRTT